MDLVAEKESHGGSLRFREYLLAVMRLRKHRFAEMKESGLAEILFCLECISSPVRRLMEDVPGEFPSFMMRIASLGESYPRTMNGVEEGFAAIRDGLADTSDRSVMEELRERFETAFAEAEQAHGILTESVAMIREEFHVFAERKGWSEELHRERLRMLRSFPEQDAETMGFLENPVRTRELGGVEADARFRKTDRYFHMRSVRRSMGTFYLVALPDSLGMLSAGLHSLVRCRGEFFGDPERAEAIAETGRVCGRAFRVLGSCVRAYERGGGLGGAYGEVGKSLEAVADGLKRFT